MEEIVDKLPGSNCGACGNSSCYQYAKKIVADNSDINEWLPGAKETEIKIKSILTVN